MMLHRRTWWFALLSAIAIVLISHKVFIAIPSRAQNLETKTFDNPTIDGIRLDRCLNFKKDCATPAAKAFCQRNGYSDVVNFSIDPSPKTTKCIGDGIVCQEGVNHPFCDSFAFIGCSRALGSNIPSYTDIPLSGNLDNLNPNQDLGPIPDNIGETNVLPNGVIEAVPPEDFPNNNDNQPPTQNSTSIPTENQNKINYKVGDSINPAAPVPNVNLDLNLVGDFQNQNLFEVDININNLRYKYEFGNDDLVKLYPTLLRPLIGGSTIGTFVSISTIPSAYVINKGGTILNNVSSKISEINNYIDGLLNNR